MSRRQWLFNRTDRSPWAAFFGLARLNSGAGLDTAFGGGSLATFGIAGVLIQKNGKIVAVGNQVNNQTGITTLMLARI